MTAAPTNGISVIDRPQNAMEQHGSSTSHAIAIAREAYGMAKVYAESDIVPQHFRGKVGNCFIALQFAWRIEMDPFMVMQGIYVVSGKPGLEGKFVLALINRSGLFTDPLDFEFAGTPGKEDWTCTASAKRKATGKVCSLPFRYATALAEGWVGKAGSKWKTMPEQMMMYRAATFFARVYCPEVIMGMQSREEIEDLPPDRTLADLPAGRSPFRPELMASAPAAAPEPQAGDEPTDAAPAEERPADPPADSMVDDVIGTLGKPAAEAQPDSEPDPDGGMFDPKRGRRAKP